MKLVNSAEQKAGRYYLWQARYFYQLCRRIFLFQQNIFLTVFVMLTLVEVDSITIYWYVV